jgi:hypothetical protein
MRIADPNFDPERIRDSQALRKSDRWLAALELTDEADAYASRQSEVFEP